MASPPLFKPLFTLAILLTIGLGGFLFVQQGEVQAQSSLVTSISPTSGNNDQTTQVTIQGNGFSLDPPPVARLSSTTGIFDLTNIVAQSSTSFSAVVPADLPPSIYDLIVISGGDMDILHSAFIVLTPISPTPTRTATPVPPTATPVPPTATPVPPTATPVPPTATPVPPTATATVVPPATGPELEALNPNEGVNDQTTSVTIVGRGFSTDPAPLVRLLSPAGITNLTEVVAQSSTSLSAVVPAGLEAGSYDLLVTSDGRSAILPNAFIALSPVRMPTLEAVAPVSGLNNRSTEIIIQGTNFVREATVRLGSTSLTSERVSSRLLLAVVPAGLEAGSYALSVTNPDGGRANLAAAYSVLDANDQLNNDLSGDSDNLWLDPVIPHANRPVQLGLLVERTGGEQALEQVEVRFHRDAVDGPVLGRGFVNFLDPRSVESTMPITVTFDAPGEVTIFAVIDPEDNIAEDDKTNNVVERTILVAPAAADQIPPVVERITINGGTTAAVREQQINVEINASDPSPGSGVGHVHVIEYIYSEGAGRWVPISPSGWLPYLERPATYRWTLTPLAGMRYIQVRARDEAGNISIGNARRLLNYEPDTDSIARNQTRVYRYTLEAGQAFEVNLEVLEGDADLYVWSSQAEQSAWVSNLSGSANERVFIAADNVVPGLYQVEVYGYRAATYRLTTNVAANPASLASLATGGLAEEKDVPTVPVLPLASIPSEHAGSVPASVPELEQRGHSVYLPLVRR